jgi:hypothetical protein
MRDEYLEKKVALNTDIATIVLSPAIVIH